MKLKYLLLGAIGTAIAAQPSFAHRMWMLPSTFTLSGDEQWITVDGAISNDLFFPNHVPLSLDAIIVQSPDGEVSSVENGWTGRFRSTFDVLLDQQGTYRVSENGAAWFARWTENGEPQRRRGSLESLKEAGLFDNPEASIFSSQRRVETFVTLGAPSETVFGSTGEGLELKPVTHPNDVFAGEEVTFGFLLDGEPAEGLEIELVKGNDRYRNAAGIETLTTDADGTFTFTPEEPGRYWLTTGVEGEGEFEGRAIGIGRSYVMTFEALPF